MRRFKRALLSGLCCTAVLLASSGAHAQDESDPRMIEARRRFAEAEEIYIRGDFAGALAEFVRIYDLLEGNPRRFFVLWNMGRCQEQLFRYGEALTSFQRYLQEGGAGAELAPQVRQKIAELEARLATVSIQTNVASAEVWVDDRHVGTAPGDIRVDGGQHNIELRARGYAPSRRALSIPARTHETIAIELDRVSAGISPVFFIGGAALTAVAAGIGIGFGAAALGEQGRIQGLLSSGSDDRFQVTQAQIDAMEQNALLADVFFGAALVFGVASVVLVFVTDWGGGASPPERASLRVAPFATGTMGGLVAEGSF